MGPGEFAALGAAWFWACSSILWGRVHLSSLELNFFKNLYGSLVLLLHLAAVSLLAGTTLLVADREAWGWLAASGLTGIVIGDTVYFRSIQILGPRRALVVASTAPLFAAALGWIFLGEILVPMQILGIFLAVSAVMAVVAERVAHDDTPGMMPGRYSLGITLGLLGGFCQAAGAVLARRGMVECPPLEATLIRLLVALTATAVVVMVRGRVKNRMAKIFRREHLRLLIPAATLGTWLGIWLSQVALKNSPVATATTLMSMCPLFAIPMVWMMYRIRTTAASIAWTVLAVAGIGIVVCNDPNLRSQGNGTPVETPLTWRDQAVSGQTSGSPRNSRHWR